jgi:riboflavin kinase/FMN adenylyltransferase
MHIVTDLSKVPAPLKGAVVALGNFDGVHKGHGIVLAAARDQARKDGRPFGVVTFEPHPRSILFPTSTPYRLTPVAAKRRLLDDMGVDVLFEIPFTPDFSRVTADDFIGGILIRDIGLSHAVAGHDFVFGHKRGGDMQVLRAALQPRRIGITEIAPVLDAGQQLYSSTRIREHIEKGEMREAAAGLGRVWEIEGMVEKGAGRGKPLGFPTANVAMGDALRPRYGVYAVQVKIGEKSHAGVANIGLKPTVDGRSESLEAHIFDFAGDLYGQIVRVGLVEFIRAEQRFDGLDALKAQIGVDCRTARDILGV